MKFKVLMTIVFISTLAVLSANAANQRIKLAITDSVGEKRQQEFYTYSWLAQYYKKHEISPFLIDIKKFAANSPTESLYSDFKKYNVLFISSEREGFERFNAAYQQKAVRISQALTQYVREGGGLIIQMESVRYPGHQDELFWNAVFKPFGVKILHEGIFDKTRNETVPIGYRFKASFFPTKSIKKHEVTQGVESLLLPKYGFADYPGTPAYQYNDDWTILVKGEKTGASYVNNDLNSEFHPTVVGTYKSSPPVVAVREFGKGRIMAIAINRLHTGINFNNPTWNNIVESMGTDNNGSQAMRLLTNAVKWAAAPSILKQDFGTATQPAATHVSIPQNVTWDKHSFRELKKGQSVRGIVGAHTSLTDGKSSVADYAEAAAKGGLAFIVFAEPLELLTPDKLNQLKTACRANSNRAFYCCPGIEFTDGNGNRWMMWGEEIKWPKKEFKKGKFTYQQWDGQKVNHYGKFADTNNFRPSAVISYQQLKDNGAFPENLWWFFNIILKAYQGKELIADNMAQWDHAQRDLRKVYPITFNRIFDASEVTTSIATGVTCFNNLTNAVKALNNRAAPYAVANMSDEYTSTGGIELSFQGINSQMDTDWLKTRGSQRSRLYLAAYAPKGIKEVALVDAWQGVLRKFQPSGSNVFQREVELTHSHQHSLYLRITDSQNNQAISHCIWLWCYKQGLFRCGDNLNILGPLGLIWMPDRNMMFPLNKNFQNAMLYSLDGWDAGSSLCDMPQGKVCRSQINIKGIGPYPASAMDTPSTRMRVILAGHDIQITENLITHMAEICDSPKRPGPSQASIVKKTGELKYFEQTDRMYAFRDNADFFKIWNYRKLREGLKRYKGGLVCHDGFFRIKEPLILQGEMPIKLATITNPYNRGKGTYDTLLIDDSRLGKLTIPISDNDKKTITGTLAPGGYIAAVNGPIGCLVVWAMGREELHYKFVKPDKIFVGTGRDGKFVKPGDLIKYRYLVANLTSEFANTKALSALSRAYNLSGTGQPGCKLKLKQGKLIDSQLFLTLQATGNAVSFIAGPEETCVDYPVKVKGLENNGCTAVFSSRFPAFVFIPVVGDTAYVQEDITLQNNIWIGNVFVADDKNCKLTLVKDGTHKKPFLKVHNPGKKPVNVNISSPEGTPVYGGRSFQLTVPAGDSLIVEL